MIWKAKFFRSMYKNVLTCKSKKSEEEEKKGRKECKPRDGLKREEVKESGAKEGNVTQNKKR